MPYKKCDVSHFYFSNSVFAAGLWPKGIILLVVFLRFCFTFTSMRTFSARWVQFGSVRFLFFLDFFSLIFLFCWIFAFIFSLFFSFFFWSGCRELAAVVIIIISARLPIICCCSAGCTTLNSSPLRFQVIFYNSR